MKRYSALEWLLFTIIALLVLTGAFVGCEGMGLRTEAYSGTVVDKEMRTTSDGMFGSDTDYYVTVEVGKDRASCLVDLTEFSSVAKGHRVIVYLGEGRLTGRKICGRLIPSERP